MTTGETLLAKIVEFCRLHGLSETRFGLLACRDGHLVRRLRRERSMGLRRLEKVEKFMAEYPAASGGGGGGENCTAA